MLPFRNARDMIEALSNPSLKRDILKATMKKLENATTNSELASIVVVSTLNKDLRGLYRWGGRIG